MTKLQGEQNPTNDVFKMGEGNPPKPLDAVKNASSRSLAGGLDTVNDLAAISTNLIATPAPLVNSPVLIIGAGLLGASIGLALSRAGVQVWLEDSSPTGLELACDLGAGQPLSAQPAP
ncbi:prephenate dehydrogenase, partial [Candidatus Saccharibacteria bacterium]|nr:prephenate dehydrogenase [Candidatus Saccharibacteria bacterium]